MQLGLNSGASSSPVLSFAPKSKAVTSEAPSRSSALVTVKDRTARGSTVRGHLAVSSGSSASAPGEKWKGIPAALRGGPASSATEMGFPPGLRSSWISYRSISFCLARLVCAFLGGTLSEFSSNSFILCLLNRLQALFSLIGGPIFYTADW